MSVKPSRSLTLGVLLLASVIMTFLSPATAGRVRSMLHWAFAPMGDAGMYLTTRVKKSTRPTEPVTADQAKQYKTENEILNRQVRFLVSKLTVMNDQIVGSKTTISNLYGFHRDIPVRLIPGRVVSGDSLPYGWTRLLNAGEKQSAQPGQAVTTRILTTDREEKLPENLAVLSSQSLVGRLTESAAFTSRLQLVTDRGFTTTSQIARVIDPRNPRTVQHIDRLQTLTPLINRPVEVIAVGDGAGGLIVREVKKVHNIREGDKLQTRPDSPGLPVAVEIGTVSKVFDDPKHPGMMTLHVTPTSDLPALREVFIVVPKAGQSNSNGGR